MKLQMKPNTIDWWLWAITLLFIIIALLGWAPGYLLVMSISALQIVFIATRERSITSFETQVRILYFLFTLIGLSHTMRFPFYVLLLLGTIMVVFFGRCGIALALRCMPWNKRHMSCSLEEKVKEHRG